MAPALRPALPFHRSHSTPDLLSFSSPPLPSPHSPLSPPYLSLSSPTSGRSSSASNYGALSCKSLPTLPSLPAFDVPLFGDDILLDLKSPAVTVSSVPVREPAPCAHDATEKPTGPRRPAAARPHSWISGVGNAADDDEASSPGSVASRKPARASPEPSPRAHTKDGHFFSVDSGQDPVACGAAPTSPGGVNPRATSAGSSSDPLGSQGRLPWKRHGLAGTLGASRPVESLGSKSRAFSRASVYLTKIKQRPQSVFGRGGLGASPTASRSPSPAECPLETLAAPETGPSGLETVGPGSRAAKSSMDTSSPVNSSSASDSVRAMTAPSEHGSDTAAPWSATRDPLEVAFVDLEAAYSMFLSRPTTPHRMAIVKKHLVPFLRRHAHDVSNQDTEALSPEDIERRTAILGRWWVALLQILDGRSGRVAWDDMVVAMFPPSCTAQLLGAVDRPALLEAATEIMMRPEWRLCTTYFRPLTARSPAEKVRARSDSAGSGSLAEFGSARSVEHRVKTMFVSILLAQMALVVDKMSLRNAPPPLVKFAGTACAYAFFFVPGVADVLVRLWALDRRMDAVTRVVDEFGLPRTSRGESEDIVALFPPSMGSLGWTSIRAVRDKLRRPAKVPLQATQIPWYGPWLSRWRGEDTDLLFVFCKHFYLISEQFVPRGLPLVEKARAPAFVLVHAQLLTILDHTFDRQAAFDAMTRPPLPDAYHGADAALSLMTQLVPQTNLLRNMDENCLIVLLRDFLLSDDSLFGPRRAFAQAFMCLLKAAAKKTRRYDHNCQYLLCDFLQEALKVYNGGCDYASAGDAERCLSPAEGQQQHLDLIDWPFWLEVCKLMLSNNNLISEIQVLSFVFSTWDIVAADPARKSAMCLDWLLTEEVFARFFTNWCPMVRAYFMRLLCWRICRDAGSPNEVDSRIFMVASERLMTTWSHYLWLKQRAEQTHSMPPTTAPSLPQPGKRFMIVRTELPTPHRGLFASPESPASAHSFAGPLRLDSDGAGAFAAADFNGGGKSASASRRRSLLGKVLGFGTASAAPEAGAGRRQSYDEELDQARRDLAATRSQMMPAAVRLSLEGPPPVPPPKQVPVASPGSDSDSTGSSLVYDSSRFVFRFVLHSITWHGGLAGGFPPGPRDLFLTRPRLPVPAQSRVSARSASAGHRSESPPPPSPGLPPPTRLVSGWAQGGLISGARNAQPLSPGRTSDGHGAEPRRSNGGGRRDLLGDGATTRGFTPIGKLPFEASSPEDAAMGDGDKETREQGPDKGRRDHQTVQPIRPIGIYETTSARYAGRALAEWSLVVNECNSFIDRRREEGVLGLGEVEVPILGVEGMRRLT